MPYTFSFILNHQDLLDAYDAERNARTGLSTWSRGAVLLLGAMWVAGFVFLGPRAYRDEPLLPFVWLALGGFIFWRFGFKPYLERRRIKQSNEAAQQVTVSFTDNVISTVSPDGHSFSREWPELEGVMSSRLGVLLGFEDGMRNWLPNRAFAAPAEKQDFVAFVIQKLRARSAPPSPTPSGHAP